MGVICGQKKLFGSRSKLFEILRSTPHYSALQSQPCLVEGLSLGHQPIAIASRRHIGPLRLLLLLRVESIAQIVDEDISSSNLIPFATGVTSRDGTDVESHTFERVHAPQLISTRRLVNRPPSLPAALPLQTFPSLNRLRPHIAVTPFTES